MSSAICTLFILAIETCCGRTRPASLSRPSWRHEELGLGDLGDHPDELLLHELEAADGLAELDALLRVLERPVVAPPWPRRARPTRCRSAPGSGSRAARAAPSPWAACCSPGCAVLERELRGDRRAHRELAVDVERREARRALLDQEAVRSRRRPPWPRRPRRRRSSRW